LIVALREKKVLVVGGGIAGAAAALELSEEGLDVILLEKEDFIGGHAARMTCKALDACQKCNGCLVEPRLAALLTSPAVRILRRSRVAAASRMGGGFRVSVQRRPAYIDPARCTACGLCLERCPQAREGAIVGPRLPGDLPPLAVNAEACLYFQDRQSSLCVDVCPEGAIDFGRQGDEFTIQADAVVLATGFRPYPAEEKPRLGYGRIPNVITSMDLETMLRERGGVCRPSDGAPPKRVGFIQ
jgi:heterodisulfide reductase subunit A